MQLNGNLTETSNKHHFRGYQCCSMATDVANPSIPPKTDNSYVPYRATKLWNEVINVFRGGLPVGRHRRQLKSYDSCFVASEAVTWLHQKLQENANFGPQVTRSQTLQLLEKFHKARLFADVRGFKYDKDVFSDGGKLFRFLQTSPAKTPAKPPSRTPLATRSSLMNSDSVLTRMPAPDKPKTVMGKGHSVACLPGEVPATYTAPKTADLPRKHIRMLPLRSQSCRREREVAKEPVVREVELSQQEVETVWKEAILESIKDILHLKSVEEVVDLDCVDVKNLLHNMTQVNKNGLVTNIDKKDQLPHWIISAMRCLAYWPDKVESNLPDYPGFEKDVFKVIKDYFWDMEQPLVTYQLYEFFLSVMVYADSIGKPPNYRQGRPRQPGGGAHNLPSSTSVEDLILNMTTQDALGPEDVLIVNDPDVTLILPGGPHSAQRTLPRAVSGSSLPGTRMETSFGIDTGEPKTRLYQQRFSSCGDDYGYHSNSQDYSDYDDNQRMELHVGPGGTQHRQYCGRPGPDNVFLPDPCAPDGQEYLYSQHYTGTNGVHHAGIPSDNRLALQGRTDSWTSLQSAVPHDDHHQRAYQPAGQYVDRAHCTADPPPPYTQKPPPYKPPPSYRTMNQPRLEPQAIGISRWTPDPFQNPYSTVQVPEIYQSPEGEIPASGMDLSRSLPSLTQSRSKCNLAESYRQAIDALGPTSTPVGRSLYSGSGNLYRSNSSPSVLTPLSRNRVYEVLQLCCLLLPPHHRRKLHLLLRFMNKASNNSRLSIEEGCSMKELVLKTFTRCILRSEDDIDHELLTQQIVTFMLEGYVEIMKVPENLKEQINEKLLMAKREKIKETWDSEDSDTEPPEDSPLVAYCQQVSVQQYEKQKLSTSQLALHRLLEDIVRNTDMNPRDKKRHLKQFQKNHPAIYSKRFPEKATETGLFSGRPRIKPPLLIKPLQKLKNLRL